MSYRISATGGNYNVASKSSAGFLTSVMDILVGWQERAAMRYQLETTDKIYLSDMGLSSAHVQSEIAKHFWRQ